MKDKIQKKRVVTWEKTDRIGNCTAFASIDFRADRHEETNGGGPLQMSTTLPFQVEYGICVVCLREAKVVFAEDPDRVFPKRDDMSSMCAVCLARAVTAIGEPSAPTTPGQ